MKITIVYDNQAHPGLKSGWGFSALIEHGENLLFDTGPSGSDLVFNMRWLNIDVAAIDKIIISHEHWDHVGGLETLTQMNKNARVFKPDSCSELTQLAAGVYSTGPLGTSPREQSVIVKTPKGSVVITGCAHPGLDNILERAGALGKVYGVVGGFHGFSRLEKLNGIELIAPCHCTKQTEQIRQRYPRQFRPVRTGSTIEL